MSPEHIVSLRNGRLTLKGIFAEVAYVAVLGALCCLLCFLAYGLAG